jgi:hypothetical protein
MTSRRLPLLLSLAGMLLVSGATAQAPLPPSIAQGGASESATAKKPPPRPRSQAAKPADGAGSGPPTPKPAAKPTAAPARAAAKPAPQRGYSETLPLPRKVDRNEIDDPYGSSSPDPYGNRMRPSITPGGGMGMGGRF